MRSRGPIRPMMQRLDAYRNDAYELSVFGFTMRWPTPVLLLRYVVEGELTDHSRGPEGTMRHSLRRTLKDRLNAPALPGRRKVGTERIASVSLGAGGRDPIELPHRTRYAMRRHDQRLHDLRGACPGSTTFRRSHAG